MPTYNLNAEHYYSNSSTQKRLANDILYLHDVTVNENILDIGCGDGVISAKLATIAYNGKVTGIDSSKEMIAFAQQNFSTQLNLFFENTPAENFCSNDRYTLITAFNSLYWVRQLDNTMRNLYQMLSPSGKMLALIYPLESLYWQMFIQIFKAPQFSKWYDLSICSSWLTSEEYIALAQKHGFKILCADTFVESVRYLDKQAFKNYVTGWLPCLFSAPKLVLDSYLDVVTNLAWDMYSHSDGSANPPYTKLHLYLEKPS